MIQGKWFAPGEDLSAEIIPLREAVFGSSGIPKDELAWNALVYADSIPAASGRIWWENGAYWIGMVGVVPALRGQHLGDLVLRLLLFKAQAHAAQEVRLLSPENTEGFFARFGFSVVRRNADAAEMMLPGNRISLDTCANCNKRDCPNRQ